MPLTIDINTNVLASAVEDAGPDLWQEFSALPDWLNGDKKPTVNQLADLAKKINVPFGYFFLDQLPEKQNVVPLFRTGHKNPVFTYSNALQKTISNIQLRQDWLAEYLQMEGMAPLKFVGSASEDDNILEIASQIRRKLKLSEDWAQSLPSRDRALQFLVEKIEAIGIFVVINGIVNNNTHQSLDRSEFQGFALTNRYAPFIFINGKDYKAAQLFTIMHELAHIWLGVSAITDRNNFLPANDAVEKICDAIAAELLVPKVAFLREWDTVKNHERGLDKLSRIFKVSRIVIARRLLDLGIYSRSQFFSFYNAEKDRWDATPGSSGGGDFYNTQPYRVGRAFFNIVNNAAKSGRLLYSDAYKLTSLYGNTYHEFANKMQ